MASQFNKPALSVKSSWRNNYLIVATNVGLKGAAVTPTGVTAFPKDYRAMTMTTTPKKNRRNDIKCRYELEN